MRTYVCVCVCLLYAHLRDIALTPRVRFVMYAFHCCPSSSVVVCEMCCACAYEENHKICRRARGISVRTPSTRHRKLQSVPAPTGRSRHDAAPESSNRDTENNASALVDLLTTRECIVVGFTHTHTRTLVVGISAAAVNRPGQHKCYIMRIAGYDERAACVAFQCAHASQHCGGRKLCFRKCAIMLSENFVVRRSRPTYDRKFNQYHFPSDDITAVTEETGFRHGVNDVPRDDYNTHRKVARKMAPQALTQFIVTII